MFGVNYLFNLAKVPILLHNASSKFRFLTYDTIILTKMKAAEMFTDVLTSKLDPAGMETNRKKHLKSFWSGAVM